MQYKFKKAAGVLQQSPMGNKDEILIGRLGRVHSLSGVAVNIWGLLEEPVSIKDISIAIESLFYVDSKRVVLDCEQVINFLIREKLIVSVES